MDHGAWVAAQVLESFPWPLPGADEISWRFELSLGSYSQSRFVFVLSSHCEAFAGDIQISRFVYFQKAICVVCSVPLNYIPPSEARPSTSESAVGNFEPLAIPFLFGKNNTCVRFVCTFIHALLNTFDYVPIRLMCDVGILFYCSSGIVSI